MTANSDAAKDVTVEATLDEGSLRNACVPDAIIEALKAAQFRVKIPVSVSSLGISTVQGNLARADGTGAIYVPAVTVVTVQSQSVTIGATVGPGSPVVMTLPVLGVSDLATALKALDYMISPPEVAIAQSPVLTDGNNLKITFYRVDDGSTAPYPEVNIQVRGKVYEFPQPQTAE